MDREPGVTKWPPDPRFVLELAVILGCFVVILIESNPQTETAAFGLLGVVVASIVSNLARR